MRTMRTPPRKKLVPFSFCLWKKKVKVRLKPMMKTKPERKRIWEEESGMGEMSPAQMGVWLRASPAGCTHVPKSQEHRVEVQEHPKEDEEGAEADQPQADPCGGQAETRIRAQSSPSGCGCCSGGLPIPFPPRNILSVSLQSLSTC